MKNTFDIAIIGSGPGGYRAAIVAALRGKRVAIIEKDHWGGCCLNRGCVPKKAWHDTATLIKKSQTFNKRGLTGRLQGDLQQSWQHQRSVVTTTQTNYLNYLSHLKVTKYQGTASFLTPQHLCIKQSDRTKITLTAKNMIIATGSSAKPMQSLPWIENRVLSTDMLFDSPPPTGHRVAIFGSGVVSTEMAFILSQYNKQISWLVRAPPLSTSRFSQPGLKALNTALTSAHTHWQQYHQFISMTVNDNDITLTFDNLPPITVDWILLGMGRSPYSDSLQLNNIALTLDPHGFIQRNHHLQTQHKNIYAIGDCANPNMTANHALAEASYAINHILGTSQPAYQPQWVPQVIYSATEMARIGWNDDQAEDRGFEPAIGFSSFQVSPCAMGQEATHGHVRLLAELETGRFLGGEIVGEQAGELIHGLTTSQAPAQQLKTIVNTRYNHPSRMEEILNASETLASQWGLEQFIFNDTN